MASLCNLLRLRRDQVLDIEESAPERQLKLWKKLFVDALTATTGAKSTTQSRSGGAMRPRATNHRHNGNGGGDGDKQRAMGKQARCRRCRTSPSSRCGRWCGAPGCRRAWCPTAVHDLWTQCGGDELHTSVIDVELFAQFVESETKEYRDTLALAEEHAHQVSIADALNQEEHLLANSDKGMGVAAAGPSSPGADSTSAMPPTPGGAGHQSHMAPAPSPERRKKQKPPKSDPQVDLFCKLLDQNGDGVITLSELDHTFRTLRRQHTQTVASAAERLLGRVRKAVDRTDLTLSSGSSSRAPGTRTTTAS